MNEDNGNSRITANNEILTKGKQKLRILIVLVKLSYMQMHYIFHRRLAHLLAADQEYVEYVHLLVLTEAQNENIKKENVKFEGNIFAIEHLPLLDPVELQGTVTLKLDNIWNGRANFRQTNKPLPDLRWRALFEDDATMNRLKMLNFNVGMAEMLPVASLAIFERLPSINWTIATLATWPFMYHYELLGYPQLARIIPGLNDAEIGDHLLVGKTNMEEAVNKKVDSNKVKENTNENGKNKRMQQWEEDNREVSKRRWDSLGQTWQIFDEILKRKLGNHYEMPSFESMFKRVSFFFVNCRLELDFPIVENILTDLSFRLGGTSSPVIKHIGGICLPKNDENDKEELDNATKALLLENAASSFHRGTILVCFGTAINMEEMPAQKFMAFLNAFSHFREYKFIWKYESKEERKAREKAKMKSRDAGNDSSTAFSNDWPYKQIGEHGNIFTRHWLPQLNILRHPTANVVSLICHGGQNSVLEAVHCGIPLLCLPFFGDHHYNSEAIAARGAAEVVDIFDEDANRLKQRLIASLEKLLMEGGRYKKQVEHLKQQLTRRVNPSQTFLEAIHSLSICD